jgi:hypothetical protein
MWVCIYIFLRTVDHSVVVRPFLIVEFSDVIATFGADLALS